MFTRGNFYRLLLRTRFPTAGSPTGAGALGRVRLNKWIKLGTQISVVFGLAALAAHLEGSTAMIASSAVNLAAAIGVAVGGRVGSSSEGGGLWVLRLSRTRLLRVLGGRDQLDARVEPVRGKPGREDEHSRGPAGRRCPPRRSLLRHGRQRTADQRSYGCRSSGMCGPCGPTWWSQGAPSVVSSGPSLDTGCSGDTPARARRRAAGQRADRRRVTRTRHGPSAPVRGTRRPPRRGGAALDGRLPANGSITDASHVLARAASEPFQGGP